MIHFSFLDAAGNLWVADEAYERVLRFGSQVATESTSPQTISTETTISGNFVTNNNLAVSSTLNVTGDLVVDSLTVTQQGNVLIGDVLRIRGSLRVAEGAIIRSNGKMVVAAGSTLQIEPNPVFGQSFVTVTIASFREATGSFSTISAVSSDPCITYGTPTQDFGMGTLSSTVAVANTCAGSGSGGETFPIGAIIGIVVGCVVIGVLAVLLIVYYRHAQSKKLQMQLANSVKQQNLEAAQHGNF